MSIMMVNPFWAAAVAPLAYSYEGATVIDTNTSTPTFSNKNIGAAGTGRLIAAAIVTSGGTPRSVTGVTADATPMTKGPESVGTIVGQGSATWFYLPITSGTTATFAVTLSGVALNTTILIYRLFPASGTPVDTATTGAGGGDPVTLTDLEVKVGGVALIASHSLAATAAGSWNGVDTPIHDEDSLSNDSGDPTDAWSFPTTENNTARDFTIAAGTSTFAVALSFL